MSRLSIAIPVLFALLWAIPALAAEAPGAEFQTELAAAQSLVEQTVAAGNEWLGTRARLETARAAAAEGEIELALQMVEEVRLDCELALAQAKREENAWKARVLR